MEDFGEVQSRITKALVDTTRSASELAAEDLPFYRSLDSTLSQSLDRHNARLLSLADRLLAVATANTETVRPPRLKDLESVEGNWKAVVDVVDSLLERADTALDEFTGAVRRLSPGAEQAIRAATQNRGKARGPEVIRAVNIEKPQLRFQHVPTNDDAKPFRPLLQSKPHAQTPLATEPIVQEQDGDSSFPHPYQSEIETYEYPPSMYTRQEPISPLPFEETTATFVDSEEAMYEMLEELKSAKEIAIDLEHHDTRSFIGIVSLMQISTRDKDWIVDTLKPWRRKLECLNEVFADPSILKVLHGAFMDIIWLQRDLGLYIVGLFDTHYACRALHYPGGSLAFLLKKFVNVDAQKQYQMADWRIRPLPRELMEYARSDTHYLLYIFDCMRNELLSASNMELPDHEGDRIWDVLSRSSDIALQRYEHPVYDAERGQGPMGWYKLLTRTPAMFTKEQFAVFRAVHQWRDKVAREQDDSVHYVMPNHVIFSLAKALPSTQADILAHAPTQTMRLRINELLAVILKAKVEGESGPEMETLLNEIEPEIYRRPPPAAHKPVAAPETISAPVPSQAPTTNSLTTNVLPMRSSNSSFWGSIFRNSFWQPKRASSDLALAPPLPPLTAEIFADPAQAVQLEATPRTQKVEPVIENDMAEPDDAFTLKELSKKRKREPLDGLAAQSDEVAIPDAEAERASEKALRKAAKKAAKRAARAQASGHDDNVIQSDEAAFDYASAPSLLEAARLDPALAKERRKQQKQLNPYAKSLDAAKGLPRAQRESAGRSMTYKS